MDVAPSRAHPGDPFGLGAGNFPGADCFCAASAQAAPASGGLQLARPGDVCPDCRRPLQVSGLEYECPDCRAVFEAADYADVLPTSAHEEPGAGALRGRLRVVGPEAGWYQPDLDRTNPSDNAEQQKKATYSELLHFNKELERRCQSAGPGERAVNPFPLDVLQDVAELYYTVQQNQVKRSMMKKLILAALIYHACIARGFTRTRAEVACLVGLPTQGIARGDDFIRSIDEDVGFDLNMNEDRLRPHVTTVFTLLGLAGKEHEPLRSAVADIVRRADAASVGARSVMRSKVAAATAEVLRRKGLAEFSEPKVAALCSIRTHTIRRFRDVLAAYHSKFADIYRAYGLDAERSR
jgi:hypothetical protein